VGMIIAIAVSSNLQGAATLVGDTTSIMLGGYAGMNFLDFFFFHGKPSIFWAVELGALCASCIILILFRKDTQKVDVKEYTEVECYFPTVLMCLIVVLLIAASLIPNMPDMINGYICMALMIIGIIYHIARKKKFSASLEILKEIDFETLLLLFSLFIVVGGITEAGVIDKIAQIFTKISGGSLFVIYSLLVWMSVVFSAFIDNIPYVMTMLPVTKGIALSMGVDPTLLYFGLLSGATLGGNLTPVGASANIAAIGILRKNGYQVKNKDFFRIGVPFTLAAIIPAYIYFWLIYA
ncbi:MAG TPA: arsenic transporter, partial [Lachnospiraceae bacterium]|nr:arsenic transporter [Lachnospiraceae bacterium]